MSVVRPSVGERAVSTVGDALDSRQVINLHHPAYKMFSEAVAAECTVLAEREAVRRSSARPLILPFHLPVEGLASLAEVFTEFAVSSLPLAQPVHSYWTALVAVANEWIAASVDKYGMTGVHYGGSLVSAVVAERRHVHLEMTATDDVMLHQRYGDRIALARMYEDALVVAKETGVVLPRQEYDEYSAKRHYGMCTQPAICTHQAETLCVDLSMVEMSPYQVACAMAQHGAEVCQGFFIYHPSMLVQDRGELADTGVYFQRAGDHINFLYPEGRAGVASYSRATWSRWCASHHFSIGAVNEKWYQLELMKARGPFMFFRMIRVSPPDTATFISHALDVVDGDEFTLVKSWRLRSGFKSDPSDASSWEPNNFLIRTRVVKRSYEFAMQLKPDDFSRHAIKKQVRIVNNRWVVQGTSVITAPALEPQQIEDLTTAIYARAFVDRYESSQLVGEMMVALKNLTAFASQSTAERLRVVLGAVASSMYNATVAVVDTTVRGWCDAIVSYMRGENAGARFIKFDRAPDYVKLSTAVTRWSRFFTRHCEGFYRCDDSQLGITIEPSAPGGNLAHLARKYSGYKPRRRVTYAALADEASVPDLMSVMRVVTDISDTSLNAQGVDKDAFVSEVSKLNELDMAAPSRSHMEFETVQRDALEVVQAFRHSSHADPVAAINQMYADAIPNMAITDVQYDTFSLSLDPQDRTLAAPYLRMPTYFGLPPTPRFYYVSKLKALSVPKRQNVAQELLSAVAARNLSAPVISVPQDSDVVIRDVWQVFLNVACVPDAREKLVQYQQDPVALAEQDLKDWAQQANPDVVGRLVREMQEHSVSLGDKSVSDYLVMIKADVKPTLSDKPVHEITAPQVIVYHDKLLSALYSSLYRVLVRRFLSLLRPEYHVNLLKDTRDIEKFLTSVHPYAHDHLNYLENDFSKYDKSQSEFAFELEDYVFRQLGMNLEMLHAWKVGHVECSLRAITLGLSLHVLYQRKSGDATTAFGNVLLNVLSVTYAYQGSQVFWALFMGDDSIVCCGQVSNEDKALLYLAEVFNLSAKFYVTDAPYFASNFLLVDASRKQVRMVPDPIKRAERLSMHVGADDPQWDERWTSFQDSMQAFSDPSVCASLCVRVPVRYSVGEGFVRDAADALGSLVRSKSQFRSLWMEQPEVVQA